MGAHNSDHSCDITERATPYDAVLVVSFGGPEGPDEVIPFLENVLRGRDVPRARLDEVATHYHLFGGVSPINSQNRALIAALQAELALRGPDLPVYWGNRNSAPLLADTVAAMRDDGIRRALAFVTSAYSSYSGCRQYLDDLANARVEVGAGAPVIDKLRGYFDHPGFVEALADGLRPALAKAPPEAPLLFSAHSIPLSMADHCDYEAQLRETARLVATAAGRPPLNSAAGRPPLNSAAGRPPAAPGGAASEQLVFQSRSGTPSQPWLGPDVVEVINALPESTEAVIVSPIGFVSDHMEVVYDLDTEARMAAEARGITLIRAATAGTHPAFVAMIAELVAERIDPDVPRRSSSPLGPLPDFCPIGHCPSPRRPAGMAPRR